MESASGLGSGRLPKSRRLLTRGAFTRVQREGIAGRSNFVVVLVAQRLQPAADPGPDAAHDGAAFPVAAQREAAVLGDGARLGIVASRKVGSAVVRNLAKRRVREWFRRLRTVSDIDVLVIVLPPAARATTGELAAALDAALGRALRRAGIARPAAGIGTRGEPGSCGGPGEAPR